MDDTQRVAWMARRLTLGAGFERLARWELAGPAVTVAELIDPDDAGVAPAGSPWDGIDIPEEPDRERTPELLSAWLRHMRTTPRPFESWMSWFWHDHFAVSAGVVRYLPIFTQHLDLLAARGLGPFDDLLRRVTVDPAMLAFLDGRRNQRGAVNENYGRELLELYALGIGNYDEDDVRAAAVALTGWVWAPELGLESRFIPNRHDPAPQRLLGHEVGDVDSVIDTVTAHPRCAEFVTEHLAGAILGRIPTGADRTRLADEFRDSGLRLATLARSLVDIALDDGAVPVVLSPIAWLNQVEALTAARIEDPMRVALLRQMGQLPGVPPNVGGYPGADTWAGPSSTVGRFRAASVLAALTPPDAPVLVAAEAGAWDELARLAARPDGFSDATIRSLEDADRARRDGREALAAALMTPDMVVA